MNASFNARPPADPREVARPGGPGAGEAGAPGPRRAAVGGPGSGERQARAGRDGGAYRPFGLGGSLLVVLGAAALALGLGVIVLRLGHAPARDLPWTVARAAGVVAYGLLWLLTLTGLLRTHPRLRTLGAQLLPWHQWLGLFTLSFGGVHGAAVVLDPYAGVGLAGALWPGLSHYRTIPVALGTMTLWSLLAVGLTARFGQRWLGGVWRAIHRWALLAFTLAFFHGVLTGSDSRWLAGVYVLTAGTVWLLAVSRYWQAEPASPPDGGVRQGR